MSFPNNFNSPGEAIKYWLDIKNWTQEDFAQIMSISAKHANELIKNKKPLSLELILDISKAFSFNDTQLKDFISLYAGYRIKHISKEESNLVSEKARLFEQTPISEMIKKGWIEKTNDYTDLVRQCKNLLGFNTDDSTDLIECFSTLNYNMHFKKTNNEGFEVLNAKLWRRVSEIKALKMNVPELNKDNLSRLLEKINEYTLMENGVETFIKDLCESGVRFVYLSHLSKTYIDGATFYSSKGPVIVMTGRYDRLDNFWFTIGHEIVHVLKHLKADCQNDFYLDDTSKNNGVDKKEQEANEIAAKSLKSIEILDWFRDFYGYLPKEEVIKCSKKLKIHPTCIVGILAFNEKTSWATVHRFKESVRDKIPARYIGG